MRSSGIPGRRGLAWAAGLVVGLVLLLALRAPILRGVGELLTVEDAGERAELIVVLNGDPHTRPFHAAALWHAGRAPRIVVPRAEDRAATELGLYPSETDVLVEVLRREGVPASAVTVLDDGSPATSTGDEARAVRNHLLAHPAGSVLIVTSAFHTRRARWIFARELDGIAEVRVSGAPDDRFGTENWWRVEAGLLAFVEEYLKFLYYILLR